VSGEFVEIDGVPLNGSANEDTAVGEVEVGQQVRKRLLAEAVDGDQSDDELGQRAVHPVDQAAEFARWGSGQAGAASRTGRFRGTGPGR